MKNYHEAVMTKEVLDALALKDNGIYIDATLGGGGHTTAILDANPTVIVYAFDRDNDAISHTEALLQNYENRLKIYKDNFVNIRSRLALQRITKIDGILFDLGVSSHQISSSFRGLSFELDGNLDMRMNQDDELTAYDVVNRYSIEELTKIIKDYGEEREAVRIARGIAYYRQNKDINTTGELAEIIEKSTQSPFKIKIKARVFQALRIYINGELISLQSVLYDAAAMLKPGGRIVAISYHSLEDRILKKTFKEEELECICPSNFPTCTCDKERRLKVITKKPILPTAEEISTNRRARSAKLRIAERI